MILIGSNIWEPLHWMTLGPIWKQSTQSNALQGYAAFFSFLKLNFMATESLATQMDDLQITA